SSVTTRLRIPIPTTARQSSADAPARTLKKIQSRRFTAICYHSHDSANRERRKPVVTYCLDHSTCQAQTVREAVLPLLRFPRKRKCLVSSHHDCARRAPACDRPRSHRIFPDSIPCSQLGYRDVPDSATQIHNNPARLTPIPAPSRQCPPPIR